MRLALFGDRGRGQVGHVFNVVVDPRGAVKCWDVQSVIRPALRAKGKALVAEERSMTHRQLDLALARQAAQRFLDALPQPSGFSHVLLDEDVIARVKCWAFFYESSMHLESGRFEDRLVGNGLILVS